MDNLAIRKATSSDVQRIVELRFLGQRHFEKSNPLIWRMTEEGKSLLKRRVENDLANDNVRILLAEADGKAIGYIQGEISCRDDYMPRIVGHVSLAYVVKKHRREGVGTLLVKELLVFFTSNKVENLTVRYIIGNKEAEGFWRKLWFGPIIMTGSTSTSGLNVRLKGIPN